MKIFVLFISLLLIACDAKAAIINSADGELITVSNACRGAVNGDTVTIPSGTSVWSNYFTISQGITVQGAGIGQTVIVCEATNYSQALFELNTSSNNGPYRITGIEFRRGTFNVTPNGSQGAIWIHGDSGNIRIDHCLSSNLCQKFVFTGGYTRGVIDHCTNYISQAHAFDIQHEEWPPQNTGQQAYGDGSWYSPMQWGTTNMWVIEDCKFVRTDGGQNAFCDGFWGSRYCVRYCLASNCFAEVHGTETSSRYRGGRAVEFYSNAVHYTTGPTWGSPIDLRSGTAVVFGNTSSGIANALTVNDYRLWFNSDRWGYANNTSGYDLASNVVYSTGTHKGALVSDTLVDTNATWTVGQWKGFIVVNTNTGLQSLISDNTSTTITFRDAGAADLGTTLTFTNGQRYEIQFVRHVVDGTGLGSGGILISNANPPFPKVFPNSPEPIYACNNNIIGGSSLVNPGDYRNSTAQVNSDYFDNSSKPGYTPLVYPHPLVSGSPTPVAPSFTVQPASASVFVGDAHTFTASATGDAVISYQWRHEGTNLPGATTTSLALSNIQLSQAGAYSVAATNGAGFAISQTATLTVTTNTPPASVILRLMSINGRPIGSVQKQ